MISRFMKSVLAAGVVLLTLSACSGGWDSGPETIRHFGIHYTITDAGTVHVVETIDYDFADADEKHGIDRFLASRFSTATAGKDRVYRYSNIKVSSPTGASALFSTSLGNALQIRVGNKNAQVNGKQTYVVNYDIEGALNRATQPDGSVLDEFYWNATGSYWDPSITSTTVTVDGSAPVHSVTCYAGYDGTQDACAKAKKSGATATFEANELYSRQGLTISVAWPDGIFTNTDPLIEPSLPEYASPVLSGSNDGPDPFWSPLHWGSGLALLAGIPLLYLLLVVARRRDRKFVGVTPGSIPDNPETAEVAPAPKDETIVVQYQPPQGLPRRRSWNRAQ